MQNVEKIELERNYSIYALVLWLEYFLTFKYKKMEFLEILLSLQVDRFIGEDHVSWQQIILALLNLLKIDIY